MMIQKNQFKIQAGLGSVFSQAGFPCKSSIAIKKHLTAEIVASYECRAHTKDGLQSGARFTL